MRSSRPVALAAGPLTLTFENHEIMNTLASTEVQELLAGQAGAAAIDITLSPAQARTLDHLQSLLRAADVVALHGPLGIGKTTILRALQKSHPSSTLLDISNVIERLSGLHPVALEEAVHGLLDEAFERSDLVLFDDLSGLENISRQQMANNRPHFLPLILNIAVGRAHDLGKRLVFTVRNAGESYDETRARAARLNIEPLAADDFRHLILHYLGSDPGEALDFGKLYSDFRLLSGYQLKTAARLLAQEPSAAHSTQRLSDLLLQYLVHSNLDASRQVEAIDLDTLTGAEHIIEVLERTVLLPLLDTERAQELGLKPKRGVLLHGAPGTGKTTIGRALAHRMKGKFYMLDGTVSSEPPGYFFYQLDRIFESAQANSPSVIFIDDADVLLKTDHVYGLNRYLLTKLDGLTEAAGDVCVIMTAMDIQDMPPPLLRSGRVEVWLETKLPERQDRERILARYTQELPEALRQYDGERIAQITAQFTPADLRRVVSDAKGLLAYDQHRGRPEHDFGQYLAKAALDIRELKNNIARTLRGPEIPETEYDLYSCGWA